jgi:hypothetical protein
MDLLEQGREEAVAELAIADPRALRPLMGRLWDPVPQIRRRAAGAIGRFAAAHSALGLETVRRLMWALNDEAATNGVYGIAALGEIGRRCPEMMAPFVPALVSMAGDDGIRLELLRALGRVAEADARLVGRHLDRLGALVDGSREEERHAFRRLVAIAKGRNGEDN